jgi:hypothetical protein
MQRLARFALHHTRATLLLLALVTSFALAGLLRLTTVVGYRGALSESHPAIQRLDRFIADFGGGLPVAAVWSCEDGHACSSVFDENSLRMALAVEQQLASNALIRRIDTPATAPMFMPSADGFAVRRFFEDGALANDREALARRALDDPLWRDNLVSADGKVGAIILQLTSSDSDTTVTVVPALQAALEPFELRGFTFHLVGDPVDFAIAGGELEKETPRIVPVMVGLIALVIYSLFRSWRVTLAALATTGLAVLWAMGGMGWLGWAQSEVTQALPPQILVIGVCDTIHILGVYATRRRGRSADATGDRIATLERVAAEVGPACVITAITTALGFLSFSTTGFDLFSRFGVIAAAGAAAALILTFTLFPILLVRIPSHGIRAQRASDAWFHAIELVVQTCQRRGKAILAASMLLAGLGLFGLSRLRVDVDERALFGAESRVVQWAEFVEDHLRKTDTLEIGIDVPGPEGITDPLAMQALSDVTNHLATLEGFGRVRSLLEPVARLHRVLRDDDPAFERPAETRAGNAQLLLALRLDSGGRLDEWVTPDLRRVRISVEADSAPQMRRGEMLAAVRSYLDDRLPEGFHYELTGPFALYYDFVAEIQSSQVSSFASAAIGIFAVFAFFLWWTGSTARDAVWLASLGMLPNVLPVLCTLGAMGLWGIPLDVGTAMVAAIVLGIATDDTVHVMTHYRDQLKTGRSASESMATTLRTVGRSAISTAVALSLGFFALTLSSWQSIASFGLLSGIAILAALLAELFLLPSFIMGSEKVSPPAERPAVTHRLVRAGRQGLTLLAIIAFAAVAVWIGDPQLRDSGQSRLACWILPNGFLPLAGSLDPACPLRAHDRVEILSVGKHEWRASDPHQIDAALEAAGAEISASVMRSGRRTEVSMPVIRESEFELARRIAAVSIAAIAVLGSSLLLLWYSSAPAAAPLAALYACLVVIAMFFLGGAVHSVSPAPFYVAQGLAPAAAAHLVLSFPHRRPLLTRIRGTAPALYAAGAVNAGLLLYGYSRYPILWMLAEWITLSMAAGVVVSFLVASMFARREACTAFERERANTAFRGVLVLLGISVLALAWVPSFLPASAPWLLAGVLLAAPAPLGYALARYQLNDLRPHFRQLAVDVLARLVYVGSMGALLFFAAERIVEGLESEPLAIFASFCALAFVATLIGARFRRALQKLLPSVDARLQALEREHAERASELQSAEEATALAAQTLTRGLGAISVSLFVPAERGWLLLAHCGTDAIASAALANCAAALLTVRDAPLHLAIEGGDEGPVADRFRAHGVELIVPFQSRGDLAAIGFVSTAENGLPYTFDEIAFARRLASRSATAIHNGRMAEELLRAERLAAVGRVAAGLAHDVGKPMSVIYQRARMMSATAGYPTELREDAHDLAVLARDSLDAVERLFSESHERESARTPLEAVVTGAVAVAADLHGEGRVKLHLAPDVPAVRSGSELARAVTNLLDNALLARSGGMVELSAWVQACELRIEIVDRGDGMDEMMLSRAFEPFFTTREATGGRGIGLASSRASIEAMGGQLVLESVRGAGTTARISLPIEAQPC